MMALGESLAVVLAGAAALSAAMAGLWQVQRRTRVAGIVDVAWSFGTAALGVAFAAAATGDPGRRALAATLAAVWGARLGLHLAARVRREGEDGRYLELRSRWGAAAERKLFGFFQLQAAFAVLFALPIGAAAMNATPALRGTDFAAIAVWCVGIAGEALADRQLARFRADPARRGRVCDVGLWRWSRHPNYFFEWLHWFAWPLLAWGGPGFLVASLGPVAMLVFLTRFTGIPPTEARALATKGDAYRAYQRVTSAFFPWPRRSPR